MTLTSVQVGVGLVGPQEHGLPRLQPHQVEEINGEAADVPWVLGVQPQQQVPIAPRRVLPFRCCTGRAGAKLGGAPSPPLNAAPPKPHWGGCGRWGGPTFLGDPLHQHVQLVDEELLLALHEAGEADAEGGRDAAGVVAPAALQLLRRHLPDQRPQLGDGCPGGTARVTHSGRHHPQPEVPKPPSPPRRHHREGRWHRGPTS